MSNNTENKKIVVQEIKEKFQKAQSVVFINYIGLTVEQVTDLRNQFRKANVEYRVLKNTMINLAANELGIQGLTPYLKGTTAVAFSYADPTSAARIAMDYIKKAKKTEIKCGVIAKKAISASSVEALSQIPSKDVLIAQLFGVMNGAARSLVTVLSQIKDQRESA